MVQILPYVPGFGEQLAESLGQAATNIGQGYLEGREKQHDAGIFKQLIEGKDQTPVQKIEAFNRMSKKGQEAARPLFEKLLTGDIQANEANQQRDFQAQQNKLNRQNQLNIANINAGKTETPDQKKARLIDEAEGIYKSIGKTPEEAKELAQHGLEPAQAALKQHAETQKNNEKVKIPPEQKKQLQTVFDESVRLLNSGALGFAPLATIETQPGIGQRWPGPEVRSARAKFDTIQSRFVGLLRELENKGALSKERFNDILKRLAKSSDSEAKTRGVLEGLALEFGLDPGALTGKSEQESPQQNIFGEGKIKVIDPDSGEEYYPTDKKDIEDAKKAGWKVISG
jgi:23S rRNA pseudoU1915 N3-methylase RlmH